MAHICSQQLKPELLAQSQPCPGPECTVHWEGHLARAESLTLVHIPIRRNSRQAQLTSRPSGCLPVGCNLRAVTAYVPEMVRGHCSNDHMLLTGVTNENYTHVILLWLAFFLSHLLWVHFFFVLFILDVPRVFFSALLFARVALFILISRPDFSLKSLFEFLPDF